MHAIHYKLSKIQQNCMNFSQNATLRSLQWLLANSRCMCRVFGELELCSLCPKAKPPHSPSAVQDSQNPSLSSAGCNEIPLSEVQIQLLLRFNKLDFLHCFRDVSLQSKVGQQCHYQFICCVSVCVCVRLCIAVRFCLSTRLLLVYILPNNFRLTVLILNLI